jgi:transcriptional regulator with GAF, ATPase, and Fis domain
MAIELRKSGIGVVGDVSWGTHFCQFYETKHDLLEVQVPFFKAGLESNETCVWIVSTLREQEARDALKQALPDSERHLVDHNLEIFLGPEWCTKDGSIDLDKVSAGWSEKLTLALARGCSGMRLAGDASWLKPEQWSAFSDFEDDFNESIGDLRMTCLCSYPVTLAGVADVLDVTRTHHFSMARLKGSWELLEAAQPKQATLEIKRLNEKLTQSVVKRISLNEYPRENVRAASKSNTILGNSTAMRGVLERIEMVALTDATVLILGETGVGKGLVARNIHERSPRRGRPLIEVNCTGIPRELFESEFFGHVKGAFSGAFRDRVGRFQLADGGTLFLDEVGDLPMEIQPKLLRVLQDGEFEAVGDEKTRRADFRMIAASNQDLKLAVREGRFRRDLYYRLSVFPIEVPALRELKEDLPVLAQQFLDMVCKRFNRPAIRLNPGHLRQLRDYDWPGNVRELRNVIERAVIASPLGSIDLDIPGGLESGVSRPATTESASLAESEVITDKEMSRLVRDNMAAALKRCGGRIYGPGGAAELLGISPSTLATRVRKLRLK